jgi:hypothetical protein
MEKMGIKIPKEWATKEVTYFGSNSTSKAFLSQGNSGTYSCLTTEFRN